MVGEGLAAPFEGLWLPTLPMRRPRQGGSPRSRSEPSAFSRTQGPLHWVSLLSLSRKEKLTLMVPAPTLANQWSLGCVVVPRVHR